MIKLTRLNDSTLVVSAHLIETIEATPDTVLTFQSGKKIVVKESVENIVNQVIAYRRKIGATPANED